MKRKKDAPARRRMFGIRLHEDVVTDLRHAALNLKRPPNQVIEDIIRDWLKQHRGKNGKG
jgi:predicted transcriptional regulator